MKTKLNQARWLVLAAFVLTGLQEAKAWYAPSQQRWINRDPLGEPGFEVMTVGEFDMLADGPNLYLFVGNHPTSSYDLWGLEEIPTPSDPYREENSRRRRCGDCSPEEHAALQAAVNLACGAARECTGGNQNLDTLRANLKANLACAVAREKINKLCFKGGDAGHRKAADNARRAAKKCLKLIERKTRK